MDLVFHFETGAHHQSIAQELLRAAVGFGTPVGTSAAPAAGQPPQPVAAAPASAEDEDLATDVDEEPKRGRGRPKKTSVPVEVDDELSLDDEKGSDDEPEEEPTADEELSLEEEEIPEEKPEAKKMEKKEKKETKGPSRADVNKQIIAFATKHGKPAAKKLLQKFGSDNIADLDEKHYAAVIAAAKK